MKISDKERIKKIVNTWASLQKQMDEHHITRELLLKRRVLSVGSYHATLQYWRAGLYDQCGFQKSKS